MKKLKSLLNKFIRDKDGKVAIFMWPNLPLIGWLVFMVMAHFVSSSRLKTDFLFISSAFLFTWSYLEIRQGTSYARRLLGLVVFIKIIVSHLK